MKGKNKPFIVIDTNLLISAIILKGNKNANLLLQMWREDKFFLLMSKELITEIELVLKREKIYKKYHLSFEEIEKFIRDLRFSTVFITDIKIRNLSIASRDRKDDHLLALAVNGKADYLITGDEDLLVLNGAKELRDLKIIKVIEFQKNDSWIA